MFSTPPIEITQETLQTILNAIPNPMFLIDRDHRLVLVNDAFCDLIGQPRDRLLYRTDYPVPDEQKDVFFRVDENDAAIGQAGRLIEEKTARAGKTVVVRIDRFYPSSQTCSACGHSRSSLALSRRAWTCPECGVRHDRDLNAARTLLAAGQTVTAHGGGVRAKRATARGASGQRSANRQVAG